MKMMSIYVMSLTFAYTSYVGKTLATLNVSSCAVYKNNCI